MSVEPLVSLPKITAWIRAYAVRLPWRKQDAVSFIADELERQPWFDPASRGGGRRWSSRDVRKLTPDELRQLVRVVDSQGQCLWDGLDAQALLDLDWIATDDGGFDGFESFFEEHRANAVFWLEHARTRTRERAASAKGAP